MAQKPQKTTRNVEFNFQKENDAISSVMSFTMTKDFKNATLLTLEDGILVTGKQINDHAKDNRTLKDLGYNVTIDTGIEDEEKEYRIYGAPFQVTLNNRQNFNNCGVESTLNTLAMAGMIKMKDDLSDQAQVEKTFLQQVWEKGLVQDDGEIGILDKPDGGTTPDDYKYILDHKDINSQSYFFTRKCDDTQYSDLNELAYKISQGYGAIVGVCSGILWQDQKTESGEEGIDHAVTIMGVVYEEGVDPSETDGEGHYVNAPVGFYIHDSGGWMSRYISFEEFKEATLYDMHGMEKGKAAEYLNYEDCDEEHYNENLRIFDHDLRKYVGKRPNGIEVTITTESIKTNMFDLNVTGNSKDNTINGNYGNNIINGMAGNDFLFGNAGDDELRGGAGNDTIVGNNITAADKEALAALGLNMDTIQAVDLREGENQIYGDAGNDVLIGGNDTDIIYGGAGNDFVWTGDGRNAAYGGAGNDIVIGGKDSDKLYGDAGNDTIFGGRDDDTLFGEAGNDHLFAGRGNDRIETGKGNDTVYIEGQMHGVDEISSKGGTTTIKFIDEVNGDDTLSAATTVSDMFFVLDVNDNNAKQYDFSIAYTSDGENATDGIQFNSIYDTKQAIVKSVKIIDGEDKTYNVTPTNSRTIKTKTGTNNIVFALNEKGATVTTNNGNDIVTFVGADNKLGNDLLKRDNIAYIKRIDKITYTEGDDRYVSEEGNTYYTVKTFDDDTVLSIYDNVEPLTRFARDEQGKYIVDGQGLPQEVKVASEDDRLYLGCKKEDFKLFFNVGIDNDGKAITTKDDGLLVVSTEDNVTANRFINIATETETEGVVYMDSFFGFDTEEETKFEDGEFYGYGRIEKMFYKTNNADTQYAAFDADLATIASQVANWLTSDYNTGDYATAFDAFSHFGNLSQDGQNALVAAYTPDMV